MKFTKILGLVVLCLALVETCDAGVNRRRARPYSYVVEEAPVPQENLTAGTVQRTIFKGMSSADVIHALGSPNMVTQDKDGHETWVYDRVRTDYSTHSTAGGLNLILFGFGEENYKASRNQKTLTIIIHFDDHSTVSDFSFRQTTF